MLTADDKIFQWIAIMMIVPALATSIAFRWRANRAPDKVSAKKEEGSGLLLLRSIFGLSFWGGTLAFMLNPGWMAWAKLPLPGWTRWSGAAIMLFCLPMIYWIFSSLGKNITPTTAIRVEHTLVRSGPYRWVRHPLYTFGSIFFVGFCLLSSNGFMMLVALGGAIVLAVRTPIEEARLLEKFGDDYRHYMRETGRYFPRWGS
jgi:protein-S-isoprenylcysteine O-methyltransferase Ste14